MLKPRPNTLLTVFEMWSMAWPYPSFFGKKILPGLSQTEKAFVLSSLDPFSWLADFMYTFPRIFLSVWDSRISFNILALFLTISNVVSSICTLFYLSELKKIYLVFLDSFLKSCLIMFPVHVLYLKVLDNYPRLWHTEEPKTQLLRLPSGIRNISKGIVRPWSIMYSLPTVIPPIFRLMDSKMHTVTVFLYLFCLFLSGFQQFLLKFLPERSRLWLIYHLI